MPVLPRHAAAIASASRLVPQALGAALGVVVLLELRVEPLAGVLAGLGARSVACTSQ